MIITEPYNLPDIRLLELDGLNIYTWVPDKKYIVLGQRDTPETALNQNAVLKDGISVMKRPSGGHTVLLSPNTIVIAISITQLDIKYTKRFFEACNSAIINALEAQGITGISKKGISDIAAGHRKILGSSMYRPKNHTFYHSVLNISESAEVIAKYLAHPKTEPEYRLGRKHSEFIISLTELGYNFNLDLFKNHLTNHVKNEFNMLHLTPIASE
jgi:lipoate---protein ligase